MPKIRVDLDELTTAMESHDTEWVLDTRTGGVVMSEWLHDPDLRGDLTDESLEEAEADNRFHQIDPLPSSLGYAWMEKFASRQPGDAGDRLLDALDRPRPFRRFKDALDGFPDVRDAWYAYHQARMEEEAVDWLRSLGMEMEVVRRGPGGTQVVEPLPPASANASGDEDGWHCAASARPPPP